MALGGGTIARLVTSYVLPRRIRLSSGIKCDNFCEDLAGPNWECIPARNIEVYLISRGTIVDVPESNADPLFVPLFHWMLPASLPHQGSEAPRIAVRRHQKHAQGRITGRKPRPYDRSISSQVTETIPPLWIAFVDIYNGRDWKFAQA